MPKVQHKKEKKETDTKSNKLNFNIDDDETWYVGETTKHYFSSGTKFLIIFTALMCTVFYRVPIRKILE